MDQNPLLTVIVPVFNVEHYVEDCIRSILNQSLNMIELVLIDDCSSDGSYHICEQYEKRDKRIRLLRNLTNIGQGRSRNLGIANSRGTYVTFVDSDDYIEHCMYERMVGIAREYEADIVRCGFNRTTVRDARSEAQQKSPLVLTTESLACYARGYFGPLPSERLDDMPSMSPCTAIYRRDVLDSGGARFPTDRSLRSEDLFFNLDYLESSEVCVLLDEVYYHYFSRDGSTSRSYSSPVSKCSELLNRAGDNSELRLRVHRSILTAIKEASLQLAGADYSLSASVKNLKHLESELDARRVMRSYPRSMLAVRERIFAEMVRYSCGWPEMLLAKLYRRREDVSRAR